MDSPPPILTPETSRNVWFLRGCIASAIFGLLFLAAAFYYVIKLSSRPSAMSKAIENVQDIKHARDIMTALRHYANDNDGNFPEGTVNSNQAFRQLFPHYVEDERIFFIPGSAWHETAPNQQPDRDIGTKPDYAQSLEKGENTWAYVSGLSTSSPRNTPLIAEGFMKGQPGSYTDDPKQKGGVRKGATAIIGFTDGSMEQITLSAHENYRVLMQKPGSSQKVDIFTREGGLPENAKVLNPE